LSEVIGPGVAAECREGKGELHVFDDHFLPEVVDPDSGETMMPGERGELVLTTLTKEAFPVLRYRTGDVTSFVDGPCPSGRTLQRTGRRHARRPRHQRLPERGRGGGPRRSGARRPVRDRGRPPDGAAGPRGARRG